MYKSHSICRDGFTSSNGSFRTQLGNMGRIEVGELREMFMPKLSHKGTQALRQNRDLVRCQLKHYGVEFKDDRSFGRGVTTIKKALEDGRMDQVPSNILELEDQMHQEWLQTKTIDQLLYEPKCILDKYFLTRGQPDLTKTTTVVGVPFPKTSQYCFNLLVEAASKVAGLHHQGAIGTMTQAIYLGWDITAVENAVSGHADKERKDAEEQKKKEEEKKEKEKRAKDKLHADYLKRRPKGKSSKPTPVGSYIVDCQYIEQEWPGTAGKLSIDIHKTDIPGLFKAAFDFGILIGAMIICADESTLEEYCSNRASDSDEDEEDDESDESEIVTTRKPTAISKRKKPPPKGPKTKKGKAAGLQPLQCLLKFKCREIGKGEINFNAEDGTIEFNKQFTSFTGEADMYFVGRDVAFSARKISDEPEFVGPLGMTWDNFSEEQYARERASRYR